MRASARRFWAVFAARGLEFLRDRGALGWNLLFPLLVVFGFSFAFSSRGQEVFKVGLLEGAPAAPGFAATRHVSFVPLASREEALSKLRRHQLDLVLDASAGEYWVNGDSPKGYLAERVMLGADPGRPAPRRGAVAGRPIRYVDWLIPGLLAMNMMFSSLFGVGYALVRYRKTGVLKRLRATPLAAAEFLSAQAASRLAVILAVFAAVFHGSDAILHFRRLGSLFDLYLIFALGGACLISAGLLVAARTASEELAGGLLNLISWPMMFLSGVWFSLEGAPAPMRLAARALPLTRVIDAARAVMTEGAGLSQVAPDLAYLAGLTAAFIALGAWLFRWE